MKLKMKKICLASVVLLLSACVVNHPKVVSLDASMVLLNFESPFVTRDFAEKLAILVIDQKWSKDLFVLRGAGRIVDLGDAWSVTFENALDRGSDPIPTWNGRVVPRTLTIRIRKTNGEILAISA